MEQREPELSLMGEVVPELPETSLKTDLTSSERGGDGKNLDGESKDRKHDGPIQRRSYEWARSILLTVQLTGVAMTVDTMFGEAYQDLSVVNKFLHGQSDELTRREKRDLNLNQSSLGILLNLGAWFSNTMLKIKYRRLPATSDETDDLYRKLILDNPVKDQK